MHREERGTRKIYESSYTEIEKEYIIDPNAEQHQPGSEPLDSHTAPSFYGVSR